MRVFVDRAFAARALDAELERAGLAERDARLATEIVYGTLRTLGELDAVLDRHLTRGRPDAFTHAALRAATYQALYLERVPSFAIVQETVELIKHKRGQGLSKLANAVLRRVVEARPKAGEAAADSALNVPAWVEALLVDGLGEERAKRYLAGASRTPPLALRLSPGRELECVSRAIAEEVPRAELLPSDVVPGALCAWGLGDVRRLRGFAQGEFAVQDEGAQLVGLLSDARPGERVLDACAGRGGKTLQLLAAVGDAGSVCAVDIHEAKLAQIAKEAARLGLPTSRLSQETIDLAIGDGGLEGGFDRALVDAPCTGLGTLRRRPEIALRLGRQDPGRMAELQLEILQHVLPLLRPGGVLVFAVCSASHAEGRGVAEKLEASAKGKIRRLVEPVSSVNVNPDEDGVFRVGPWLSSQHGAPDVYQIVRWEVLDSQEGPV
jgi:16S rRNA (cytosine967-C5)-methyltransferase